MACGQGVDGLDGGGGGGIRGRWGGGLGSWGGSGGRGRRHPFGIGLVQEGERGGSILYGCRSELPTPLALRLRQHRAHLARIARLGIIPPTRRPCLAGPARGGTRFAA